MTQRRFFRSIASVNGQLLAVSMLALLPLAGCGDNDVEAKVTATNEIVEQTRAGTKAAEGITVDNRDERATSLEGLASKTAQIGGTNDQKAAAGILAAEMAATAGSLLTAELRDLEIKASKERGLIAAAADAAATLEAVAEADAKLSLGADREFLKRAREGAEGSLKTLQSKIKELETPIGDLRKNVESRRAKLVELQQKADALRRQANDAGASAGFQYVEQSADVKMNAAQLRATIAGDELNLFELEPELNRANVALTGAQSVVSAADSATQALENFSTELTTNAKKLTEAAESLRAATQTALDALNAEVDGPMAETFDKASALFEMAARNASRGGAGREFAEAGAQAKLDAEANLATLGANRVSTLNAQIALLEQLAASGSLFGGEAKQKPAIEALTTKRDEALTQTKERFAALLETLNGMDAEKTSVARMKTSVESMIAALEGKALPSSSAATTSGATAPTAGVSASTAAVNPVGAGFATQQELVDAYVGSGPDILKSLKAARTGFAFSSPEYAALFTTSVTVVDGLVPIITAIDAKFGPGSATTAFAQMGGNMADAASEKYEFVERNGKPFLKATSMKGTFDLPIVNSNGRFYVQGDPMFASVPPDQLAMAQAMAPMMSAMRDQMKTAFAPVVQAIESGQITSLDEVGPAMQKALGALGAGGAFGQPRK